MPTRGSACSAWKSSRGARLLQCSGVRLRSDRHPDPQRRRLVHLRDARRHHHGPSSIVRLSNGAQCSQVKWCVGAAATLGAQSTFSGSITSQAAITLGAGAIVHGSVKSAIGVITYGAESKAVACAAAALALHASLSAVAGCPVGNAGPRCSPCPVGSYSLAGATRCTHCPPGFSCPIASVGPDACYPLPASIHAMLAAVGGCPVGNAGPACSPCPIGSYSLAGATQCTSCAYGYSCPIASVGPDACYPVSAPAPVASVPVVPAAGGCAVGNAGPGCTPCPIGSYSLAGATRCTQCPSGYSCPIASVGPDACYPL